MSAELWVGFLWVIMYGALAFFIVLLLSAVYRYFTNKKLSSFIGILFGLGFLGFTRGLLAILEQPTFGGNLKIVAVIIFIVWGVNTRDKIGEKLPKKGVSIVGVGSAKATYITVKLPHARLI